ncbi:unnamed protein product, partial [Choristocarpus tenellus]
LVSLEIISSSAEKGEVLMISGVDGGVHPDLALFLGSPLQTVHHRQELGETVVIVEATMGGEMRLKHGFRLIMLTNSLDTTADSHEVKENIGVPPVVLLQDSLAALSGVQVIRFGGTDYVGARGHGLMAENSGSLNLWKSEQDRETSDEDCSSEDSGEATSQDSNGEQVAYCSLPPLILAGMGLTRLPGYESCLLLEAEINNTVRFGLSYEKEGDPSFSHLLNTAHEAVIGLLSTVPNYSKEGASLSGLYFADQNRVLNKLLDLIFSYHSVMERVRDVLLGNDRTAEKKLTPCAFQVRLQATCTTTAALALLSRFNEALTAWGADPALFDPSFPGVQSAVVSSVKRMIQCRVSDMEDKANMSQVTLPPIELDVVKHLVKVLGMRVPPQSTWLLPIAAMAVTQPNLFPCIGWWRAFLMLVAAHNGQQLGVTKPGFAYLFRSISSSTTKKKYSKHGGLDTRTIVGPTSDDFARVISLIQDITEIMEEEKTTERVQEVVIAKNKSKRDDEDEESSGGKLRRMPHSWDTRFNTSGWAARVAEEVEVAQKFSVSASGDVCEELSLPSDSVIPRPFLDKISQLVTAVKQGRSSMNPSQVLASRDVCNDEGVVQRLILIEASMTTMFSGLTLHVLTEANVWNLWLKEVEGAVKCALQGHRDKVQQLYSLLNKPPPIY